LFDVEQAGDGPARPSFAERRYGDRKAAMSRSFVAALTALTLAGPAVASAAPRELSTSNRLDDRRFVTAGPRAYDVGTEAGRYPAMGFHTRGEMGGIWTQPLKLLDGIWFGVDGQWLPPAARFTSGWGYVRMGFAVRPGLRVQRTDFVPGARRGVLIRLRFRATGGPQRFTLQADAHSELMSIYPWGETKPFTQREFNLPDAARVRGGMLVFTERGTPPVSGATAHDWAAVVAASRRPSSGRAGDGFRGPQDPPVICPPSGPDTPQAPPRCDDTAYGKGKGGRLTLGMRVPAGGTRTVWFTVSGSEAGARPAVRQARAMLRDPGAALRAKIAARRALGTRTRLSLPGDPLLARGIQWSKQNLADAVQEVRGLQLREVNAGKNYPAVKGVLRRARFYAAGFPDYPWLFATDGEYTAFAAVGLGQFEPLEAHLLALRDASRIINGNSGKVVHEVVSDGSVYFGALDDPGNTDETAKFPSTVALLWRWTGDRRFLRRMYPFTVRNMRFIVDRLDEDGDGWPGGLGNVERPGMGEEKLDNTVYTIRGLYDLADMAGALGDRATRRFALSRARALRSRFESAWWMPSVPGYADSLDDPGDRQLYQRHWITVTPMEVELTRGGRALPGLAAPDRAAQSLAVHERRPCYGDDLGMFHTASPGCDDGPPPAIDPANGKPIIDLESFSLNTSIIAVGEGNYGRLGSDQQRRWTTANRRLQLPNPDEQPGAMPEIAPSPGYSAGGSKDKPFNERAMVLQAWGAYGTVWPVVHQQLGVRPDLGRARLEVVPQLPSAAPIAGRAIRLGRRGSVAVAASRAGRRYRTTVTARAPVRLRIGHTLPAGAAVRRVTLNGRPVRHRERRTNRGLEVTVAARVGSTQRLVVTAR
jgi:hypothetical protein